MAISKKITFAAILGILLVCGITGAAISGAFSSAETPTTLKDQTIETLNTKSKEISSTTIEGAKTVYDETSFGYKNQSLLVDHLITSNKDWWPQVYEKHFLPKKREAGTPLNTYFNSVNAAYSDSTESTNPSSYLNQACRETYRITNFDDETLKSNIKIFCTKDNKGENLIFPTNT